MINKETTYLDGHYLETRHWELVERSERLLEIFSEYVDKKDSILELGCSAGRNLKYLEDAGYKNLTGLEMSEKAVRDFQYKLVFGRFEDKVKRLKKYDVIFSMSFLQEFENNLPEIAALPSKVKKYLITIDDHDFEKILIENGLKLIKVFSQKEPFTTPIKIYEKSN